MEFAVERLEDRNLLAGMWSDGRGAVQASQATVSDAENADVAIAPNGHYVVVWQEGGDILFRQFTPSGDPLNFAPRSWLSPGPADTTVEYAEPSVAIAADGSFVVAFTYSSTIAGTTTTGIGFTRFHPDGTPIGIPALFSTTGTPSGPGIAATHDGRFVIAWQEEQSDGSYGVGYDVFDAEGNSTAGYAYAIESVYGPAVPDVAVNPVTGEFVIVYEAHIDVFRKIYASDGSLISDARSLQADTDGAQRNPSVAMNAAGDIFYAWQHYLFFTRPTIYIRYGHENMYGLADSLWPTEASVASAGSLIGGVDHPDIATTDRRDTIVITWIAGSRLTDSRVMTKQFNLATNLGGEPARSSAITGTIEDIDSLAVAMNARGDYVLAYGVDFDAASGNPSQVFAEPHRFQPFDGIGIFRDGLWSLDLDFDNAYGYGDTSFYFGLADDLPVVGDWDGDGFANVGVFRDGIFYLDLNGDFQFDQRDLAFRFGLAGDQPVVGDWNGDGRDDIGVFRNGNWYLDANGSYDFELGTDAVFLFGLAGDTPVVTDLFNEGRPIWGVFRNGVWSYDRNRNGSWDAAPTDVTFEFGQAGDQALSGNWFSPDPLHRTGIESPAVFRHGTWLLDVNEDFVWTAGNGVAIFGNVGIQPFRGTFSTLALKNATSVARQDGVAVFRDGRWALDANGNQTFDSMDHSFRAIGLGYLPIAGDFDGDGFDETGVFLNGRWLIDVDGNRLYGTWKDRFFVSGTAGDRPVVGDWNGDGRDEVGIFRDGIWVLDSNGNFEFDADDEVFSFGADGVMPLISDWNADGRDDIGIFKDGLWRLDYNGNRQVDLADQVFFYGAAGDQPVVGDWNGDGFDDVGVKRGVTWFLDKNGNYNLDPLDAVFTYGLEDDLPLAGRWPIRL